MQWVKSRITQWTFGDFPGDFTITEIAKPTDGRSFRLEPPGGGPVSFETLAEAKAHAGLLNRLSLAEEENARLREALGRLEGTWPPALVDDDAEAERAFNALDGAPSCPVCHSQHYVDGCCRDCEAESEPGEWPGDDMDQAIDSVVADQRASVDDGRGIPVKASV